MTQTPTVCPRGDWVCLQNWLSIGSTPPALGPCRRAGCHILGTAFPKQPSGGCRHNSSTLQHSRPPSRSTAGQGQAWIGMAAVGSSNRACNRTDDLFLTETRVSAFLETSLPLFTLKKKPFFPELPGFG